MRKAVSEQGLDTRLFQKSSHCWQQKDILHKVEGKIGNCAGEDWCKHPADTDFSDNLQIKVTSAFCQADAHHRANHSLRAGHRHQWEGWQMILHQKVMKALGGKEKQCEGYRYHHDKSGDGCEMENIFSHGEHHPFGIGYHPQRHSNSADKKKLLHRREEYIAYHEVFEGRRGNKHTHHVADVVCSQTIGSKGAGDNQKFPGDSVLGYHMNFASFQKEFGEKEEQKGHQGSKDG